MVPRAFDRGRDRQHLAGHPSDPGRKSCHPAARFRPAPRKPRRFAPGRKPARHTSRLPSPTRSCKRRRATCARRLYVSDLNRAYQYWDSGNIQRVEELLEHHGPTGKEADLRGVEWYYLRRVATRFQAGRIADVQKPIWDLALSPDGKSLAAISDNGAITIWDSATGDRRFYIGDASAGYLAYTADGTLISASLSRTTATGPHSTDIRLRGWDVATGKEVVAKRVNVDAGDAGSGVSLADDGTAVWGFTSDGKLRMWDTATGHEIVTLDPQAADPSIERARGHLAAGRWPESTRLADGRDDDGLGHRDQDNPPQAFACAALVRCRGVLRRRQTRRVAPRRPAARRASVGLERRQTGGRDARICGPRLRLALLAGWQSACGGGRARNDSPHGCCHEQGDRRAQGARCPSIPRWRSHRMEAGCTRRVWTA